MPTTRAPGHPMPDSQDLVVPAPPPVHLAVDGGGLFPVHRIYAVGRNYAEHAREMGHGEREPPFFFMKPADAAWSVGPSARWRYPPATSDLHHEVELVVAIGLGGQDIGVGEAGRHVWGYGVGLDLTRRDLQSAMKRAGRPWCIAKGFDRSAPVAALVPRSRTGELRRGAISLDVNTQARQRGDLADMIWGVDEIIARLSQAWELMPGDLVFTGTPAGVGPLVPGDHVSARIDGLPPLDLSVE